MFGLQARIVGYSWTTGPWTYADRNNQRPVRQQDDLQVNDPMSGLELNETNRRLASGDRVFVLKYLPFLQRPKRWDVVVFKNPGTHENYIKRLVGMPGEQVIFVDGDVFARDFVEGLTKEAGWETWEADGWEVQRKPERVQRTMFQDVFDSRYTPIEVDPGYRSPFSADGEGWDGVAYGSSYSYDHSVGGSDETELVWNGSRALTDANAYNQTKKGIDPFASSDGPSRQRHFPDSDVALSLNIECVDGPMTVMPILEARGMEFRGVVDGTQGAVRVEMKVDAAAEWEAIDSGEMGVFSAGEIHHVEFWHVDQALWLFVDGKLVCGGNDAGGYSLTPAKRASLATGRTWNRSKKMSVLAMGVRKQGSLRILSCM